MGHHLAQVNLARLLHPLDHPDIREFAEAIARINQLAESSPGFVWRLKEDVQHPWSADPFMLVNLSVWQSPEDLKHFAYRTNHADFYRRRAEWFSKPAEAHTVLWWIAEGTIPTLEEAKERLDHYRQHGSSPRAFWFQKLYPAPSLLEPVSELR